MYGDQQAVAGYGAQQPVAAAPAPVEMQPTEQPPVEEIDVESSGDAAEPKKKHSEKFNKFKKGFTITMLIIGIFSGGLAWFNAMQAYNLIKQYTDEYSDSAATWQTAPYLDLQLVESGSCPSGWSDVGRYRWAGLNDACNCVRNSSETDSSGACSSEEESNSCFTVDGLGSFTMPFLDEDVILCGLKGDTPANKRSSPSGGNCPTGNACGGRDPDSFLFCYPDEQGYECPLTDLVIELVIVDDSSSSTNSSNNTNFTPLENAAMARQAVLGADGYDCAESTGQCLFYMRGNTLNLENSARLIEPVGVWGFPLIVLRTQPGLPCYLNDGKGYKGRKNEYTAAENEFKRTSSSQGTDPAWYSRGYELKDQDDGCQTTTAAEDPENGLDAGVDNNQFNWDVRWVTVYARQEAAVLSPYLYNGTVTASVPPVTQGNNPVVPEAYFFTDVSYVTYMAYETELPWFDAESFSGRTEGCPITRDQVIDTVSETDNLASAQLGLFVITTMTFFIIGLGGTYFTLKYAWKDDDGKIEKGEDGYHTLKKFKYCKWGLKIFSYGFIIVSIIVALGITAFFVRLVEEYGGSGQYCSDDLSQKGLQTLEGQIAVISKKDAIAGLAQIGDFAAELSTTFADKIVELIAGF